MKRVIRTKHFWLLGLFFGLTGGAHSFSDRGDVWAKPYRLGKIPNAQYGCGTCHINPAGGGARNSFGRDYEVLALGNADQQNDKYTGQLGALDSDGDGLSNDKEFAEGTHPGDHKSPPPN